MKKRIKFISDQQCELLIDAKRVSLKAHSVHSVLLEEGVYLFTCSQNGQEMKMEYCHIQPNAGDLIKISWVDFTMVSTLYPQYQFVVPEDPLVQLAGGYRLYDVRTKWIKMLPEYNSVWPFRSDGFAVYEIAGGIGKGLIDKHGEVFIFPRGEAEFSVMRNGYLIARIKEDKASYSKVLYSEVYNAKGELLLKREGRLGGRDIDAASVCADGLIRWCRGSVYCDGYHKPFYGYINLDNEEVIPCVYQTLIRYGYELFIAGITKCYGANPLKGIINKQNEVLVPFEYEIIEPWTTEKDFEENPIFVVRKNKNTSYKLINKANEAMFDESFEDYKMISGKLWIKIAEKWIRYNLSLCNEKEYHVDNVHFINGLAYYDEEGALTPIL